MEIERKFLLNGVPAEAPIQRREIKTIYTQVSRTNNKHIFDETRIRKQKIIYPEVGDWNSVFTVKGPGDLERVEIESPIANAFFDSMVAWLEAEPILKDFYIFQYGKYEIEVSIVDDNAFIYAEVEFDSVEEAEAFEWPWKDILIREITYEKDYKMANYWMDTRI